MRTNDMRFWNGSGVLARSLSRSRGMLAAVCLLWSLGVAAASATPPEGEAVIVDNAFTALRPAILRQPYQRMLDDGERPFWTDPRPGGPALQFDTPRITFGSDVLMVDPVALGKVEAARAERLAAVVAIVTPERMQTVIREAARRAGEGEARVIFSREAGKAQVAQLFGDRDSGHAMVIQRPVFSSFLVDPGAMLLSWDDRQILITLRVQRFRKMRGEKLSIRDLGPLTAYHYVGAPVPDGVDPVTWWTANDGERLLAALRTGYERIIRAARSPLPGKIERNRAAIAPIMVGDALQRFPGVLVDEDAGVARLALGKAEFLLVDTGARD
jgi:hypothetical protein